MWLQTGRELHDRDEGMMAAAVQGGPVSGQACALWNSTGRENAVPGQAIDTQYATKIHG